MNKQEKGAVDAMFVGAMVIVLVFGVFVYTRVKSTSDSVSSVGDADKSLIEEVSKLDELPSDLSGLVELETIQKSAGNSLNGASIVGIELELEDGVMVYKVKLSDGRVIIYDAKTGDEISKGEEEFEISDEIPAGFVAGITLEDARAKAASKYPDKKIVQIELEAEDGKVVYSVRFSDGSKVDIDAKSGAIVRIRTGTEDEKENDDDHDDDNSKNQEDADDDNDGTEDRNDSDDDNDGSNDDEDKDDDNDEIEDEDDDDSGEDDVEDPEVEDDDNNSGSGN